MKRRNHSVLVATALNNFKSLESSLIELIEEATTGSSQIIIPEQNSFAFAGLMPRNEEERLRVALQDLWYRQNEDAVTTRKYIGVVLCDDTVIKSVISVNEAKDLFAESVRAIQAESNRERTRFKEAINELCSSREELARMGMARINLNQCYRHIHYFEDTPKKIQYSTSTKEKSITRIDLAQAEKELLSFNSGIQPPHIQIQLQKLAGLKPGTPLAIVRELSRQIKVNLFYPRIIGDKETLYPITRKPGLPIFVHEGHFEPEIRFKPKNKKPEQPKNRDDILLESECFLPSISAFKYL